MKTPQGLAEIKGSRPELGTIALRCDIDALPIEEKSGVSYASLEKGAHTAYPGEFMI